MPKLSDAEAAVVLDLIEKCKKPKHIHYHHKVAVAISQLFNALLGGMPDETFSSRVYRKRTVTRALRYRVLEKMINMVFFYESDHCFLAYRDEITQRHVHPHLVEKRLKNK